MSRVLSHSEFIDEAVTLNNSFNLFPGGGFPYLWNGSFRVKGELYNVSDAVLRQLDDIEGTPTHYQRVEVDVKGLNLTLETFYQEYKAFAYMAAKNFGFKPIESRRIGLVDGVKEWLHG